MSVAKNYPGKFLLSYLPRNKFKHEYITITPEGYRFRSQNFDSVNSLLKWFKEHFRDPIPMATPTSTPRGSSSTSRTPYTSASPKYNSDAITKLAQNMPTHMLNSLSQATSHTPRYDYTPGDFGSTSNYVTTPYTPSGQTPYMTPYQQTPHSSQTPRYGSSTPSQHSNGSFVHPGSVSMPHRSRGGGHNDRSGSSPFNNPASVSPYSNESANMGRYGSMQQEKRNWEKATDSWMSKGRGGHQNRDGGRNTPRGGGQSGRGDFRPRNKFPNDSFGSSNNPPFNRGNNSAPSPRPMSNAPQKPSNSPTQGGTLASLGDSTPLWDE